MTKGVGDRVGVGDATVIGGGGKVGVRSGVASGLVELSAVSLPLPSSLSGLMGSLLAVRWHPAKLKSRSRQKEQHRMRCILSRGMGVWQS